MADFAEIRERGFYYVDKTRFIPYLERYKAPVFLRPRRFGKSLLVSMLAHYYDRSKSHRFEELFGGTWIGTNPTPEHNQYMIIRYDFSKMVMDSTMDGLEQNFNDLNCSPVEIMVEHNRDLFGDFKFSVRGNATKMLEEALAYVRMRGLPSGRADVVLTGISGTAFQNDCRVVEFKYFKAKDATMVEALKVVCPEDADQVRRYAADINHLTCVSALFCYAGVCQ